MSNMLSIAAERPDQPEALGLYDAVGYRGIQPFGEYTPDRPHSRFLAKLLAPRD